MSRALDRLSDQLLAVLEDALAGRKVSPPEAGRPLWRAFQQLSATRSYHANGPNPISYAEIEAFCRVMRQPLEPGHVQILVEMDSAWIEHFYRRSAKAPEGVKTLPPASSQPITAALFDISVG